MKTGRLLKFQRPGAEIHAYLYQDGDVFKAAVFVRPGAAEREPSHEVSGAGPEEVERQVRAWIEARFPRQA
ncbi:MAG: hypothetical protein AB7O37_10485 [Vicinamibacteria bacterium]